jgi:hypothetical protein
VCSCDLSGMADVSFDEWLDQIGGITKAGREKLEKSTVVSLTAVKFMTLDEILEVKLGVGDRGIFRAGWESLQAPKQLGDLPKPLSDSEDDKADSTKKVDGEKVDGEKLYTIAEITKFFGQSPPVLGATGGVPLHQSSDGRLEALAAAASIKSTPSVSTVTVQTLAKDKLLSRLASEFVSEGLKDTLTLQELAILGKGEKALLPINFCTVFNGIAIEEEEIGCGEFAGRLVWQSGKGATKRPTPDRLSFGQFFEANSRILNLLQLEPDLHVEYLDYLRQVGILLQTFTASSVFCLDHLHRQFVHESAGKAKWNFIENTLQNSVLKKKDEASRQHQMGHDNARRAGRSVPVRAKSNIAHSPGAHCYCYNLFKGCQYGDNCFYPHICSWDGCGMAHPAYRHVEATKDKPPRFRNGDSSKQSA